MTFSGAVVGCEPTAAGPKGLARWRKSASNIICDRPCAYSFVLRFLWFKQTSASVYFQFVE